MPALYLNGMNITTLIANAGASISSTSQLSVTSVTCSADVQARDVIAKRELHADGAVFLNSTVTVAGIVGTLAAAVNSKQTA